MAVHGDPAHRDAYSRLGLERGCVGVAVGGALVYGMRLHACLPHCLITISPEGGPPPGWTDPGGGGGGVVGG